MASLSKLACATVQSLFCARSSRRADMPCMQFAVAHAPSHWAHLRLLGCKHAVLADQSILGVLHFCFCVHARGLAFCPLLGETAGAAGLMFRLLADRVADVASGVTPSSIAKFMPTVAHTLFPGCKCNSS